MVHRGGLHPIEGREYFKEGREGKFQFNGKSGTPFSVGSQHVPCTSDKIEGGRYCNSTGIQWPFRPPMEFSSDIMILEESRLGIYSKEG